MLDFAPAPPVCVVSTHLDDAVFSCGHFVASQTGAVVITVFAGAPPGDAGAWDRLTTGQTSARAALSLRHDEDRAALGHLGAHPLWLGLLDGQYEPATPRDRAPIVEEVTRALDHVGAASVVAPLGLRHPDHEAVADACLLLARDRPEEFYLYMDMPYAQAFPDDVGARLGRIGVPTQEMSPSDPADPARKQRAVDAYASQMAWVKVLAHVELSMADRERYWRVS